MRSALKRSSLLRFIAKAKFAAAAFVALAVASVGFAAPVGAATQPANKEACKNGGWQQLGFSNQGQCVRAAVAQPGNGYGGNVNVNINVNINLNVHGSNNIIVVVIPPLG